jgi:3-hydroxyisobutyrate dehydrogenase-like beta-hydroxyacid dehydrogenase
MTIASTPATLRTVAFIGLGIMGGPMAAHLLDAGFSLRVHNRTAAKAAPLVERGAVACATPREAAAGADAVVTMVTDTPDVEAVLFGPEGAVPRRAPRRAGHRLEHHRPRGARALAARLRALGLAPLDAR